MVLPSRSRNANPPTRRELVHAHEWRRRDLVIWDNRQTMHRARRYMADDMRRTTIAGDGPTAPQVEAA
jgi:alpha-ketoglutarate-dependent 2,4-dichlorophenoxyacetate dioxygenase